ncbi:hypothetical protein [Streptomyces sp. NPDC056255]|uniref:hypothetical protein n=1 Tax=Streptomyces sp. NPDC056255 TaxID=3345764 RepID=UPI0035E0EB61
MKRPVLTAAGVLVRWNLSISEWFIVEALAKRTGVPALAAYAQKQAAAKDISYAKCFLPGWRGLPPLPEPGTAHPALRAEPIQVAAVCAAWIHDIDQRSTTDGTAR